MAGSDQFTNQQVLDLLFIIAPQLATTDPVKLAAYNSLIDALRCMVNSYVLGCCSLLAFANLVAHYLTISNNPSVGITSSISEGQLSLGFATTVNNGNFYYSTPYGQAYWTLIKRYKIGAYVTNTRRFWYGPQCNC